MTRAATAEDVERAVAGGLARRQPDGWAAPLSRRPLPARRPRVAGGARWPTDPETRDRRRRHRPGTRRPHSGAVGSGPWVGIAGIRVGPVAGDPGAEVARTRGGRSGGGGGGGAAEGPGDPEGTPGRGPCLGGSGPASGSKVSLNDPPDGARAAAALSCLRPSGPPRPCSSCSGSPFGPGVPSYCARPAGLSRAAPPSAEAEGRRPVPGAHPGRDHRLGDATGLDLESQRRTTPVRPL